MNLLKLGLFVTILKTIVNLIQSKILNFFIIPTLYMLILYYNKFQRVFYYFKFNFNFIRIL